MSKFSRVQTFSESTFNPATWLATGISVGLHVLLWVVTPALPSGSTSTNNARTVGLVQLTPEELSRLPEYSLPQLKLPPLPPPRPTNILPPLQSDTKLPLIPIVPNNTPPATVDSPVLNNSPKSSAETHISSRPEQSSKDKLTNRALGGATQFPSQQPVENDRSLRGSSSNLPAENSRKERTSSPQSPTNESKGFFRASVDRVLNGQNTPEQTERNLQEEFMRGRERDDRFVNGLPGGVREGMLPPNRNSARNNQSSPNNSGSDPSPAQTRQNSNRERDLLSIYGYSENNTTIPDSIKNLSDWLAKIPKSAGEYEFTKLPPELVKSPRGLRLPRVSQAEIAVLVNPDGKIVGEPILTRSTGYRDLNEAAIETVKKRSFPSSTNEQGKKYHVYVYAIEIDQNDLPPAYPPAPNS